MKCTNFYLIAAIVLSACGAGSGTGGDGGMNHHGGDGSVDGQVVNNDVMFNYDIQYADLGVHDAQPNPDAFFAMDPPPMMCGPDGSVTTDAMVPGGTPACPDDKNREGCPCPYDMIGMTAPCWPGLRVNRDHGICHDGTTTCMPYDEMTGAWGPCMGAVLPTPGVTLGPQACMCFSSGQWAIANLSPCFVQDQGTGSYYAVSTYQDSTGMAQCPSNITIPPMAQPGSTWSSDTLHVDCSGQFHLCYTLKAGDASNPTSADCTVAQSCVDTWYGTANTTQMLPPLPSWAGSDSTCATAFATTGGYGEMSVVGLSGDCENIASASAPYVFQRVKYCPLMCNMNPTAPGCTNCMQGGSGMF